MFFTRDDFDASSDPGRLDNIKLVLAIGIAVLAAYWPMLAGQIVFHRDSALLVFPARWFVRQSLLAGEFPAWNPYQGLGFPLLADPQYGVFYPPHWLFLLVPDGMVVHLASWLSLAHDPLGPNATWRDSQERAVRYLTPNTVSVVGLLGLALLTLLTLRRQRQAL